MKDRIEKHGMHCYSCNKLFDERESVHVEVDNEEHEICEDCYKFHQETHAGVQESKYCCEELK